MSGNIARPNLENFYLLKPTAEYHKEFPPSDENPECFCTSNQQSAEEAKCPKCKADLFVCCLKVNGICIRCNQRNQDPVNIFKKSLTEVMFCVESPLKLETTLIFNFNCDLGLLGEHSVEVRCMKPGKEMIQFPMLGRLEINSTELTLLKPLIKASNQNFRKDSSYFISASSIKSTNQLKLKIPQCKASYFDSYQSDTKDQNYYLGVYLVKRQTCPELIQNLMKTSSIGIEEVKKMFFTRASEDEPVMDKIRVTLKCPLTLDFVSVPGRGKYCQHLNPFCIKTLFICYAEKRKWNCPLCSRQLHELVIDNWLWGMIKNRPSGIKTFDVEVDVNGNYRWVEETRDKNDNSDEDSPVRKVEKPTVPVVQAKRTSPAREKEKPKQVQVIDDDSPRPVMAPPPNPLTVARKTTAHILQRPPKSTKKPGVIVLDLSDQSEKQPQAPIQQPPKKPQPITSRPERKAKQSKAKPARQPASLSLDEEEMVIPVMEFTEMTLDESVKLIKSAKESQSIQQPPLKKKKQFIDQFRHLFRIH